MMRGTSWLLALVVATARGVAEIDKKDETQIYHQLWESALSECASGKRLRELDELEKDGKIEIIFFQEDRRGRAG